MKIVSQCEGCALSLTLHSSSMRGGMRDMHTLKSGSTSSRDQNLVFIAVNAENADLHS
jgi:hypothetical protein